MDNVIKNLVGNDGGVFRGVNVVDEVLVRVFARGIIVEDGFRLGFVSLDPALDNVIPGIIEAVVFQSPFAEAAAQFLAVRAGKMENAHYFDVRFHDTGLADIPWNTVQDQEINIGFEVMGIDLGTDVGLPELHGEFVRDELAFGGVFYKSFTEWSAGIQRAENIAAGKVDKTGNAAKDRALSALAAAGSAEYEEGLVGVRWRGTHGNGNKSPGMQR